MIYKKAYDLDPSENLQKLVAHLETKNFGQVEMKVLDAGKVNTVYTFEHEGKRYAFKAGVHQNQP